MSALSEDVVLVELFYETIYLELSVVECKGVENNSKLN